MLNANQIARFLPANTAADVATQVETFLNQPGVTLQQLQGILNQAGIQDSAQVAIDLWAADQAVRPRPVVNPPAPPAPAQPRPVHPNPDMVFVGATLPDINLLVDTRNLPRLVNEGDDVRPAPRQPRRPIVEIVDDDDVVAASGYRGFQPWHWLIMAAIVLAFILGIIYMLKGDATPAPAVPDKTTMVETAPAAPVADADPAILAPAPATGTPALMTSVAAPSDLEGRVAVVEATDTAQDAALANLVAAPTKTLVLPGQQNLAEAFKACGTLPILDQASCRTMARIAAN